MDYGYVGQGPDAIVLPLGHLSRLLPVPIILPDGLVRVFSYVMIYKWFMCIVPVTKRIPGNVGGRLRNV
jgi:hypothetical protein